MQTMKFGVDIDGVIANSAQSWLNVINDKYQTNFQLSDLTDYYKVVSYKLTQAEREEVMLNSEPYKGSQHFVKTLKSMFDVTFITSRGHEPYLLYDDIKEDTFHWLKNHGFENPKILFTGQKKEVMQEESIDAIIDDNPGIIQNFAKPEDPQLFILDQPWNKSAYDSGAIRTKGYTDSIIKIVKYYGNKYL